MNARSEPAGASGEIARLGVIAKLAIRKGLAHYAVRLGFGGEERTEDASAPQGDARRLREAFEELGPTFVKFGQMIAGRRDIFPEELVSELRKLHDAATEFPAAIARQIIEEDTGQSVSALFASFDDRPIRLARSPRPFQANHGQRHAESAVALQDTGGGVPLNGG